MFVLVTVTCFCLFLFAEKMPAKIFVGNIAYGVTEDMIRPLFEHYGMVTECDILGNFGFVVSIDLPNNIIRGSSFAA